MALRDTDCSEGSVTRRKDDALPRDARCAARALRCNGLLYCGVGTIVREDPRWAMSESRSLPQNDPASSLAT